MENDLGDDPNFLPSRRFWNFPCAIAWWG